MVSAKRIAIRNVQTYCGILLDDNNRKPICRLHFNSTQKYVSFFDTEKEERIALHELADLYTYARRLKAAVARYDTKTAPRHSALSYRTLLWYNSPTAGGNIVSIQNPILLRTEDAEPQPDMVLLRPRADFYSRSHPEAQDVYLVIEVADTSVEKDREVKFPVYARAGILEAWRLDVYTGHVEIHRQPTASGYGNAHLLQQGELITPLAFLDLTLAVNDFLPPEQRRLHSTPSSVSTSRPSSTVLRKALLPKLTST